MWFSLTVPLLLHFLISLIEHLLAEIYSQRLTGKMGWGEGTIKFYSASSVSQTNLILSRFCKFNSL